MYRKQNRAKTGKRFGWSKNGRVTSVIGAWGGVTVGSNQLQAVHVVQQQRGERNLTRRLVLFTK